MNRHCIKQQIWATICCSLLLITLTFPASATYLRASSYIDQCRAYILTESSGEIEINFLIYATDKMDKIGVTSIQLYEDAGDGFDFVKTFRHTDREYKYIMSENSYAYSSSVPYTGEPGNDYYAVVYFLAEDESGGDTDKVETTIVTAR